MTLILNNDRIIGCDQKEQLILCKDCIVTDVADCPYQQKVLSQLKEDDEAKSHTEYERVALEIAELVERKQREYGDSFGNSEKIFQVLYPDGVEPEQMKDFLTVVRVVDKLFRIARGNQGEESAWKDILGYSLLSVVRDLRKL